MSSRVWQLRVQDILDAVMSIEQRDRVFLGTYNEGRVNTSGRSLSLCDRIKIQTMIQIKPCFQSFEEYLSYDDGTENLYELFNGELIQVPPESGINVEIATFLLIQFSLLVGYRRVRGHGLSLDAPN